MSEYEDKLVDIWIRTKTALSFKDWLVIDSERNHKKSVQMSGDLGESLGKIAELEAKNKEAKEALNIAVNDVKRLEGENRELMNFIVLRGYSDDCSFLDTHSEDYYLNCTCGLDKLLK